MSNEQTDQPSKLHIKAAEMATGSDNNICLFTNTKAEPTGRERETEIQGQLN